jgi:hypothetical protein
MPPPTTTPTTHRAAPAELVVRVAHRLLVDDAGLTSETSASPTAGVAETAEMAETRVAEMAEVAEVVGYGPVPVAQIRTWMSQGAFVAVVATADHDPLDVHHVLHLGRRSPLTDQLWLPDPPRPRAGPDRDTTAHHIKIIAQLTTTELTHPALHPLHAALHARSVDVTTLVHRGRRPNAAQRTALQWRSPECAVLGCHNRIRLEADHTIEWHLTHHTTLTELEHLCRHHHRMKTHDGYRLAPGTGTRPLLPPPHPAPPP